MFINLYTIFSHDLYNNNYDVSTITKNIDMCHPDVCASLHGDNKGKE